MPASAEHRLPRNARREIFAQVLAQRLARRRLHCESARIKAHESAVKRRKIRPAKKIFMFQYQLLSRWLGSDYRANRVAILINSLIVARAVHFAAMILMEGAVVFRFIVAEPALRGKANVVKHNKIGRDLLELGGLCIEGSLCGAD
jgi:hypothetical protein